MAAVSPEDPTTDQLRLLFFGSLRRCQDRLLWLYRHRVIDRLDPAGPFRRASHKRTGYSMRSAHTSSPRGSDVTGVALAGIVSRTSTSTRSSRTAWSATGSLARDRRDPRHVGRVGRGGELGWGAIKPHRSLPPYERRDRMPASR